MLSWQVVKYVLTAAIRDRLILSFFLLMVVGASMAIFLGAAAISETDQFAIVFAAGGLRFAGATGLILFIVFYLRRSFETKDVEFLLTRPVSRLSFLCSHFVAFVLLALILASFVFITLCSIAPQAFGQGHILWFVSLIVEYIIVANVSMFFSMVISSAAGCALSIFAFYVLARVIGQILGILGAGIHMLGFDFLSAVMNVIALIIPRLDLLAQTTWLIYGPDQIGFGFVITQGVIFSALVFSATSVDLVRRQF